MLSYVVAGITCVFAALCYAEFASMVPVAGSAYTYAYATLGEMFAWIIGWDLVLEYAVGSADGRERLVELLPDRAAQSSGSGFRTALSAAPYVYDGGADFVAHGRAHQPPGGGHRRDRHRRARQGDPGERAASTRRWSPSSSRPCSS